MGDAVIGPGARDEARRRLLEDVAVGLAIAALLLAIALTVGAQGPSFVYEMF